MNVGLSGFPIANGYLWAAVDSLLVRDDAALECIFE
jgi:hypothetical protein